MVLYVSWSLYVASLDMLNKPGKSADYHGILLASHMTCKTSCFCCFPIFQGILFILHTLSDNRVSKILNMINHNYYVINYIILGN